MSQEEDILFCRIAIQNGLVSEANAQKALALCDKREKEDGDRPQIGAVLTKYNLMGLQDVKRIYEAVRKRSGGGGGGSATAPRRVPSQAASAKRRAPSGVGAPRKAARRTESDGGGGSSAMDQQTLLLGIGGILALLVILGVLGWLVMRDRVGGHGADKKGETARESDAEIAEKEKKLLAGSAKPASSPGAPAAPVAAEREMPREELNDLNTLVSEARKEREDDPQGGLARLLKREEEIGRRGYKKPANLIEAIAELKEAVAQKGAAPAAEPKAEGEAAAPQAAATPAPEPAPAPEEKPAETKPETDEATSLLEEE